MGIPDLVVGVLYCNLLLLGLILLAVSKKYKKVLSLFSIVLIAEGLAKILNILEGTKGVLKIWPHVIDLNLPIVFAIGPCILFFTNSVINKDYRLVNRRDFLHLAVILLLIIAYLPFYCLDGSEKIELARGWSQFRYVRFTLAIMSRVSVIFYLIVSINKIKSYGNNIKAHYSSISHFELIGFKRFMIVLLLLKLSSFVDVALWFLHMKVTPYFNIINAIIIFYVLVSLGVQYIIQLKEKEFLSFGNRDALLMKEQIPEVETSDIIDGTQARYQKSPLKDEDVKRHFGKLEEVMIKKKPYLSPDLTLNKLALEIQIPMYQLSQVINQSTGKSFYEFINSYRIEEAKILLANNSNFTIEAIAFDCGFNSKPSFYSFFKKYVGVKPLEYQKNNSNKN